jgi:hypothetical protein
VIGTSSIRPFSRHHQIISKYLNSTHEGDTPLILATRNSDEHQWSRNGWLSTPTAYGQSLSSSAQPNQQQIKDALLMRNHIGRDAFSYIINPCVCKSHHTSLHSFRIHVTRSSQTKKKRLRLLLVFRPGRALFLGCPSAGITTATALYRLFN